MLADSDAVRDDTPPRNAAEAVQRLTQESQSLATKLRQLIGSLQRSSSDNVSSTLQHLAVYDEAVQSLQVMIGQLAGAVTEMKTKRHFPNRFQLMELFSCHRQTPQQQSLHQMLCSRPVASCMKSLQLWTV